ncbi:hypothetical protein [Dietzia psychralcaliphila]|uniref:hypothetical protein n=1 Tax=Dietzia psychralcaliphila TaxID=139021 RepID=UPI001C1E5848|nr:hypothetical protein [Dietzia psychralcaliphila]
MPGSSSRTAIVSGPAVDDAYGMSEESSTTVAGVDAAVMTESPAAEKVYGSEATPSVTSNGAR